MVWKINIAISGGPCTGKSTLAAALFASQKVKGYDYDLIGEESRKLGGEFGNYQSPFERIYMWRQQMREENRSAAQNGFITDSPLFNLYVSAKMYSSCNRDLLAVRELFRWWLEEQGRYQLIVVAKDPREFPYKTDGSRKGDLEHASKRHALVKSFVEHFHPELLFFVNGSLENRIDQVEAKLEELRK